MKSPRPNGPIAILLVLFVAGCASSSALPSPGSTALAPPTAQVASPSLAAAATAAPSAMAPSPTPIAVRPGDPWVLYGRHLTTSTKALFLIRPDGSGDHQIVPELGGSVGAFDWSADGTRIAFVYSGPGAAPDGEIWTAAADGSGAAKLLDGSPDCSGAFHPGWSPDGKRLAFVCYTADGNGRVSTWDFATKTRHDLFRYVWPEHLDNGIRWSPDGKTLAFDILHWNPTNEFLDGSIIALVPADGGKAVRITKPDRFFAHPTWRPDGKALLVNDYDLGNMPRTDHASNLYELGLDGKVLRQITTASVDGSLRIAQGTWEPSGARIWASIFTPGGALPIRPGWVDPMTGAWTALPVAGGSPELRPAVGSG